MIRAVNIGGGPRFQADGWLNLDSVSASPFVLYPDCTLPIESASLDLVYSSHTLEHLDDATVARVLDESWRVLRPPSLNGSGKLLIKIPDFDAILAAYRCNDTGYMEKSDWNMAAVVPTLAHRRVPDTIATRTAWVCCGWWNREYGHLFVSFDPHHDGAYHGPPVMGQDALRNVLALSSPHAIASVLRDYVIGTESDYTFNHQNAWSRDEFVELLRDHGFVAADTDADEIIATHKNVPEIEVMRDISAYYVARIV